jgi:protein-S-isoprenylcysteine O-methyltransferase Ste14
MTDIKTTDSQASRIAGLMLFLFSLVAYGLFLACFALFLSFLGGWGWHDDFTGTLPVVSLVPQRGGVLDGIVIGSLANIALVVAFGLQHSLMARKRVKAAMARIFPKGGMRILYVFTSSAVLIAMILLWQPLPGTVWHMEGEALRAFMWTGHVFGWVLLMASVLELDFLDFTGLAEGIAALRGQERQTCGEFRTPFLYRFVRHPLMTGLLIGLWCIPTMSTSVFAMVLGFTAYIFIGLVYEERDLVAEFGDAYRAYKLTTPSILPNPFQR